MESRQLKKMKKGQFTEIRDWKLNNINEGSIVKTKQGTKFFVEWSDFHGWCIIQCNLGKEPELKGDWFELKSYMQPNLEVIGNIYDNPELTN